MSDARGVVMFEDGSILHCYYFGASDGLNHKLFDSAEVASIIGDIPLSIDKTCNHVSEKITVFADYGNGMYWEAEACRKCKCVLTNTMPYEDNADINDGIPDWARPYV